jgi:hypothetical protein
VNSGGVGVGRGSSLTLLGWDGGRDAGGQEP